MRSAAPSGTAGTWSSATLKNCSALIEEEGEKVFGETQERYADLAANDITAEAEHLLNRIKQEKEGEEEQ